LVSFILKRFWYGFLVMLGVVSLVFLIFNVIPGDPARMMLGQRADGATIEAINKDLGRDQPLYIQYFRYLNDVSPLSIHSKNSQSGIYLDKERYGEVVKLISVGNAQLVLKTPYLRRSYASNKKVSVILMETLPQTAVLALFAMFFATIVGIIIGIFSAIWKDSLFDKSALLITIFGMAGPSFFIAIIFAWFFGFVLGDITGLNMTGSLYEIDPFTGEYISWKNLILPAITLGIRPLSIIVQLARSAMLDVLNADYIRTAKAKGLSRTVVILKHSLKNALNPLITAISGWLAGMMAGAVFIEYVFGWRGIGKEVVDALEKYDFPVVTGAVLSFALIFIMMNILVDLLYAWVDPRIKLS
jgi:peptide/nickel transport system permease protein